MSIRDAGAEASRDVVLRGVGRDHQHRGVLHRIERLLPSTMSTPDTQSVSEPGTHPGQGPSAQQLAQINQLATIARFVSGLAHELNNSLQVMSGVVELMTERGDLPPEALVRLQKIGGQADRATAAIRRVLTFVREPVSGHGPIDFVQVIERALALRRYQLARQGVEVDWRPPAGAAFTVVGQERALQQVIVNLLVNAEEALAGQPERRLHLGLVGTGDTAQLHVTDSGPGVPPSMREQIFEPFYSTRTSERSLGLGLTAGLSIAAAHGGRLYLADAGPGATFVLELPLKQTARRD
jgi:two-component system, NtrC family, C4-dicarboxylate transport sensor histidine kinase DctB